MLSQTRRVAASVARRQVALQARALTSVGLHRTARLSAALFAQQAPQQSARLASLMTAPAVRSFSAAASASAAANAPDMFCFQCEQTENGTGCTTVGVCGKTPDVAAMQDLLIDCIKGLSVYANAAIEAGKPHEAANQFVLRGLFATVTNVNFDEVRLAELVKEAQAMRDAVRESLGGKALGGVADFDVNPDSASVEQLIALGKSDSSIFNRKLKHGDDIVGLQEMSMYGLKGTAAYAEHALQTGKESAEVYQGIVSCLAELTKEQPTVDELLALALRVGEVNLQVMALLDEGHTSHLGHPVPTPVPTTPFEGKCILVSGHDMMDLEALLKQTEGKGINVYTHGEMLPAHSYPGLKKYPHLVGHYGGAWQLQKFEFSQFPGAIVMTTNCLIEPRKSYKHRIFTRSVVGWPGVQHLTERDFSPVIDAALAEEGFSAEDADVPEKTFMTGFGRNAVMGVADKVIEAVKSGAIKRFFLMGGCDGAEGERSYYKDVAKNAPEDTVFLTLGCGKYRINSLEMGDIGGIPRVLDMGQCNDAYSAVQVAVALANAFETDVNGLPLSFAISWFEQKAVAVLLTLLHLGIRDIRLGPNLPGFATPAMLDVLVKNYNIMPIGDAKADLELMLQGK